MQTGEVMTHTPDSKAGGRTVFTCWLANNITLGLMFGSFGALLASNEHAFGVARDTISFGMSALTTTMGFSALVMGNLVRRLTPRRSIALGVGAAACAFIGLGLTSSLAVAMVMWALLGFSAAMAAILGPVALAAEVFPDRAGKVLGLVNLPVALFVSPWLVTAILPMLGREQTYLLMAAIMVPVLALVLTLPRQAMRGAGPVHATASVPATAILGRGDFWMVSFGIAVIACTGTAYTVHAIPFAQSRGLSGPAAALMMSAYSGAGLAGVPLFGWLADRIGAPRTLALTGVIQSLCWAGLAWAPTNCFLFLSAALGAATTPLTTLHGTAMAQLFKVGGVGKAMGYSFVIKLPFLFSVSPAVGYAYMQIADYRPAFFIVAVSLIAAVAILLLGSVTRSGRGAQMVPT
jgi:MFS family permease